MGLVITAGSYLLTHKDNFFQHWEMCLLIGNMLGDDVINCDICLPPPSIIKVTSCHDYHVIIILHCSHADCGLVSKLSLVYSTLVLINAHRLIYELKENSIVIMKIFVLMILVSISGSHDLMMMSYW